MIVAMILFSAALAIAVWCITMSSTTEERIWIIFLILSGFCILAGLIIMHSIPTNKNVKEGRARYVEQNHIEIVNGDTIDNYKTYQIEWIENSK